MSESESSGQQQDFSPEHRAESYLAGRAPHPWRNYSNLNGQRHGRQIPHRVTFWRWRKAAKHLARRRTDGAARYACGLCFRPLYVRGELRWRTSGPSAWNEIDACDECLAILDGLVKQLTLEPPWREDKAPGPGWYRKRYGKEQRDE